jgi:hypothetical protein
MPEEVSEEGIIEKGMHELLLVCLGHLGGGYVHDTINCLFGDIGDAGFPCLGEYRCLLLASM